MNPSRALITAASAVALVSAISFAYAQTTDPTVRPSTSGTMTMPADTMPNTNPSAPMNTTTTPATGSSATTPNAAPMPNTGSMSNSATATPNSATTPNAAPAPTSTDSSTRTPMPGTDGATVPVERTPKLDRG